MSASLVNDPEHWRDRAREKRALAERLRNELAKQTMLRIANDFDRFSRRTIKETRHKQNRFARQLPQALWERLIVLSQ